MLLRTLDDQYLKMPWDAIDTVVFDVGNVLLQFDPNALLMEYFPEDAEKRRRLLMKVFRSVYWPMLDRGTLSYDEAIEAMTGRDEELRDDITRLLRNWHDLKVTVPEGIRTLKNVKAHGKRILILSNYHNNAFEYVQRKYDFFDLADGFVVSAHLLMLKPSHEIYQYTVDRYGLNRSRTLFIDDTAANIEAALQEGWQGVCFNRPGLLDDFFDNPD